MSGLPKRPPVLLMLLLSAISGVSCFAKEKYAEVTPREHSTSETALYLSSLYVLSGLGYFLTSREKIQQNASWENYQNNFGRVVMFDTDSPNSNWIVHLYTGSQAYLFYRGRSYTKTNAFLLTALQSALFEFTIEVIQEQASLEDLINTPLLGSVLGRGFELASISFLNSDIWPLRLVGHLINLPTIFGLYEGKYSVHPLSSPEKKGLVLMMRF